MKDLQVVLESTTETETRLQCSTEYQEEVRERVVKKYKTVPVEEERICAETFWVDKEETIQVEYEVLVPVKEMRTKKVKVSVPEWTTVEEPYTVKVPVLKEIQEKYKATVPVLKNVEFTYTVDVPVPVESTRVKSYRNMEPVVRTKTITECIPVTKTQTSQMDYGHWETRAFEVPVTTYIRQGGHRCCVTRCQTVCKRVWVPHVVCESTQGVEIQQNAREVNYIAYEPRAEQIEFKCVAICYKPQTRTGTKQVVVYEEQERTRPKLVAQYVDEERTRTRKKLVVKEETRTEKYPVISYKKEKRTKDVTYTVKVPETRVNRDKVVTNQQVCEDQIETYKCRVAVPVVNEVQVQVEKCVPKVVEVMTNPCGVATSTGAAACCGSVQQPIPVQKPCIRW